MTIDLPPDADCDEIRCYDGDFTRGGTGHIVIGKLGPDCNTAVLHVADDVTGESATVGLDGHQMARLCQAAGYYVHGM